MEFNESAALVQRDAKGLSRQGQSAATAALVKRTKEIRKRLREGAIAPWANSSSQYYAQTLESLAKHYKISVNSKFRDLPEKVRDYRSSQVVIAGEDPGELLPLEEIERRSYESAWPMGLFSAQLARESGINLVCECDGQVTSQWWAGSSTSVFG